MKNFNSIADFRNWKSYWTKSFLKPKSKWIEYLKFYSVDFGDKDLNESYDEGVLIAGYFSGNGKTWTVRMWTDIPRSVVVDEINNGTEFREELFLTQERYGASYKIFEFQNPIKMIKDKIDDIVEKILKETGIETLIKIRNDIKRKISKLRNPLGSSIDELKKILTKSLDKELKVSQDLVRNLQTEQGRLLNKQSQLAKRVYKNLGLKNVGLRGLPELSDLERNSLVWKELFEGKDELKKLQDRARKETFKQVGIVKNIKTIKKLTDTKRIQNVKDLASGVGWVSRKVAGLTLFFI